MKFGILLAAVCSVATVADVACAQPNTPPSTYAQIASDTRKLQNEYELMTRMGARPVVLDLVPFGGGSDAFYQRGKKADEIAFVCPNAGYKGGPTTAMIVRTEAGGDGGRFYHLDRCVPKK
jgi:hypothetical protein